LELGHLRLGRPTSADACALSTDSQARLDRRAE
jgi:hypothetical protein